MQVGIARQKLDLARHLPDSRSATATIARAGILVVLYATLALWLSVDYVASGGFFVLAIAGMLVGLGRGFLAGFAPVEKKVLVAFVALPAVAVLCYAIGMESELGFRIIGRMCRLALFIPVYAAIRWARPRARWLGFAMLTGVAGALVLAWLQLAGGGGFGAAVLHYRAGLFPEGYAGDHITFGDLSVIQGFVAGALLLNTGRGRSAASGWYRGAAGVAVLLGVATATLSGARGAWLSAFAMAALALWLWHRRASVHRRRRLVLAALLFAGVAAVAVVTPLRGRLKSAWHGVPVAVSALLSAHSSAARSLRVAACPNTAANLRSLAASASLRGGATLAMQSGADWTRERVLRCAGTAFLEARASAAGGRIVVQRNGEAAGSQKAALLAQGRFRWRVQGGAWHRVALSAPGIVAAGSGVRARSLLPIEVAPDPGSTVRFVPIQLHSGAYTDYWARTSAGARLAMWAVALRQFVFAPGHGRGYGAFRLIVSEEAARGLAPAAIEGFEHPHSDYLNVLYGAGLLGLVAMLALWLAVPRGVYLLTGGARRGRAADALRDASLMLVTGLAVAGLTETLLVHSFCNGWLVVMAAALLGCAARRHTERIVPGAGTSRRIARRAVEALRRWWHYRDLLRNLVAKDIKVRYQGAFLGFAWSLMNPLLMSLTYYVVFTVVFKSPIKHYAVFMVTGMLHWNLFALVAADASEVLVGNQSLLKKLAFPRLLIPLGNLLVNLTLWLMGLLILFVLLTPLGGHFSAVMLVYPLFLLLYLAFLFGIQLCLCVLYVDFRDLKHLVEVLLMILFWSAPVVYPITHLPAVIRPWMELSPLTEFVMIFQSLIYRGQLPPAHLVAYFAAWTVVALWLGGSLFLSRGRWVVERL